MDTNTVNWITGTEKDDLSVRDFCRLQFPAKILILAQVNTNHRLLPSLELETEPNDTLTIYELNILNYT